MTRFGRQYIYLDPPPESRNYSESGTLGTWRLRVDDTSTPDPGGGGGGDADLSVTGTAGVAIEKGQLLYLNGTGQLELASAASVNTAAVVGMSISSSAPGEECTYTRNVAETILLFNNVSGWRPG